MHEMVSCMVVGPLQLHKLVVLLLGHLNRKHQLRKVPHRLVYHPLAILHPLHVFTLLLLDPANRLTLLSHALRLCCLHLTETALGCFLIVLVFAGGFAFVTGVRFPEVTQPHFTLLPGHWRLIPCGFAGLIESLVNGCLVIKRFLWLLIFVPWRFVFASGRLGRGRWAVFVSVRCLLYFLG